MSLRSHALAVTLVLSALVAAASEQAWAQTAGGGFQLNRFEPTTAGEWSFSIDHPWYSSTRYFAAGLTLNYGHNPLVLRSIAADGSAVATESVIEHQLIGHVDLAGSFLDRVTLSLSLPVTLFEQGGGVRSVGVAPLDGVGVGDPRLGLMVRLFGQPDRSPVSLHLGSLFFVPLRALSDSDRLVGETGFRALPRLVLAGRGYRIRWSILAGFYYRPESSVGANGLDQSGRSIGSEVVFGGLVQYSDVQRRFAIGPELRVSTVVIGGQPFSTDYTSLEALLGVHYNAAKQVQLGLAGGIGVMRTPGTPDGRLLFRVAYAPIREPKPPADRDHDRIPDRTDACPDTPGEPSLEPRQNGCPPPDRDGDGVLDRDDLCPDESAGSAPDPGRRGCPIHDRDRDGVIDERDLCPDEPAGQRPDASKPGCPSRDSDGDGVLDPDDQCPDKPAGLIPDPQNPGCPGKDRDGDQVADPADACPDVAGAPDPDPKLNGCPGLVEIKNGMLKLLRPVYFATKKDIILPQSFPVLSAVRNALRATPTIKKVRIEGHTDNRGNTIFNLRLSDRRAQSVKQWLIMDGVEADRLESQGYGPTQPIADNQTARGRAANRRVDFRILEPALVGVELPKGEPPAPPERSRHHRRHKGKPDAAVAEPARVEDEDSSPGGKRKHHRSHRRRSKDRSDEATQAKDAATEADDTKPKRKRHHRSRRHKQDAAE